MACVRLARYYEVLGLTLAERFGAFPSPSEWIERNVAVIEKLLAHGWLRDPSGSGERIRALVDVGRDARLTRLGLVLAATQPRRGRSSGATFFVADTNAKTAQVLVDILADFPDPLDADIVLVPTRKNGLLNDNAAPVDVSPPLPQPVGVSAAKTTRAASLDATILDESSRNPKVSEKDAAPDLMGSATDADALRDVSASSPLRDGIGGLHSGSRSLEEMLDAYADPLPDEEPSRSSIESALDKDTGSSHEEPTMMRRPEESFAQTRTEYVSSSSSSLPPSPFFTTDDSASSSAPAGAEDTLQMVASRTPEEADLVLARDLSVSEAVVQASRVSPEWKWLVMISDYAWPLEYTRWKASKEGWKATEVARIEGAGVPGTVWHASLLQRGANSVRGLARTPDGRPHKPAIKTHQI
jgi:hypothetical protein